MLKEMGKKGKNLIEDCTKDKGGKERKIKVTKNGNREREQYMVKETKRKKREK